METLQKLVTCECGSCLTESSVSQEGSTQATKARIEALERAGLSAAPVASFQQWTRLTSKLLPAPVSLVSFVDDRRQFFPGIVGLPEPWCSLRETPLTHSFCWHVVVTCRPFIVSNARLHDIVCDNLAVSELGVRAYLGVPIFDPNGVALGAFCVIDTKERIWTKDDLEVVSGFAVAVASVVAARSAKETPSESVSAKHSSCEKPHVVPSRDLVDKELLAEVAPVFLRQWKAAIGEMRQALVKDDLPAVASWAARTRGSMRQLGFWRGDEVGYLIETSADSGESKPLIAALVGEFEHHYRSAFRQHGT